MASRTKTILAISIHALLAESDCILVNTFLAIFEFLSTLSLRRATLAGPSGPAFLYNFYPRSPCGERRVHYDNYNLHCVISIHALLAESDAADISARRGASISIHALLAESDSTVTARIIDPTYDFYPRSPCGERHHRHGLKKQIFAISIHALLAESDNWPRVMVSPTLYFYPRSPCGERPEAQDGYKDTVTISIHALLAESDCWSNRPVTMHT